MWLRETTLEAYRSITRGKDELTYPELKEKLLNALGLGLEQTRQKFWNPNKRHLDSPMDTLRQFDSCYSGIVRTRML